MGPYYSRTGIEATYYYLLVNKRSSCILLYAQHLWFLLPAVEIGFAQASFTIFENYSAVTVLIDATGEASHNLTISVRTEDGTATGKSEKMHNNLV